MVSKRLSREAGHRRKFLAIIDDTPECERAVAYASRRAQTTGGVLVLLYVIEPGEVQHWLGVEKIIRDEAMATAACNGADIQDTMGMTPTSDPPMLDDYQVCLVDTGAATDLPNREWTVLPNDPEVWKTVAALKFVVLMDDGAGLTNLLSPGGSVSISYRSMAALVPEKVNSAAALERDSVAYNSIAGAATGRIYPEGEDPLDLAYRLVTEPR